MVTWEYLRIYVLGLEDVRIHAGFDKGAAMYQWLKEKLSGTLPSEYLNEVRNLRDMKVDGASNGGRHVYIRNVNIVDILNILGSEGWETAGTESSQSGTYLWLKRQLPQSS